MESFWRQITLRPNGRDTYNYASVKEAIIGSDNGLASARRQGIMQTNTCLFFIEPLGTSCKLSENSNNSIFELIPER